MFSPPAFITIGDEYDKKDRLPDRFKGKSMLTRPGRKGHGVDTLLGGKFMSLSDGDKYVDPGYYERKSLVEKEKKRLKVNVLPFKHASGTKQMNGSGTYFGTFNKKPIEHAVEYDPIKKGEQVAKHMAKHAKAFIASSPAKHGTYGFPWTTISKGDEFRYVSDPYDGEKRKEALKAREAHSKIVGPAFKPACKRGNVFDESSHGFTKVYTLDQPLPARKPDSADSLSKSAMKSAWKPAGRLFERATKQPILENCRPFGKPPEYMEDPYEAKEKLIREQRLKDKPKKEWKPVSTSTMRHIFSAPIKFTPA
jgi:hypothetical protein